MKTCDIVIPTYNGAQRLRQYVIPALLAQQIPDGWHVRLIVCDDGSENPYRDNETWSYPWQVPKVMTLTHSGISKARNAGITASTADVILFLGDDIILREGALQEHLVFHDQNPDAHQGALGCIVWDPRITPTPFMEWMMHGGQQNDYDAILGASVCDASHFFYGSFVSLKRALIGADSFSEEFTQYGWEDLEFGSRLAVKGFVLTPLHASLALHRHAYSASAILARQRLVGAGIRAVNTTPTRRMRHFLYQVSGARFLMGVFMKMHGNRLNIPWIFQYVTAGEFWYGVYNGPRIPKMFTDRGGLSTELSTNIPQTPSIFAIIVHFGDKAITNRAVVSLQSGTRVPDHIIVIDHGDMADSPLNKGYAAGLAEGIRQAAKLGATGHDLILLMNNDATAEHDGIQGVAQWWTQYGGPSVLAGTTWGSVSLVTGRARIVGNEYTKNFFRIPYVHGAFMALEHGLALNMVFPEELFMYWEDVVVSVRAQKQSVRLMRISSPVVHHDDEKTDTSDQKLYYLVRNGAYVLEHELSYVWRLYWYTVNTVRQIYHRYQNSHTHQIIAEALADARAGRLGAIVIPRLDRGIHVVTIGAVIVTHNSEQYITKCVESLRGEGITDIVVVDSASTDTTLQEVNASQVQVIALSENKGFGYAANKGAQHMNTDYVLFINPDAYLETGALQYAQDLFDGGEKIGVVGLALQDDQGISESAGYGYEPTLMQLMRRQRKSSFRPAHVIPRLDRGIHVDWVSGGAMVVKKAIFDQLGGFDEQFFLYWEDVDFCRRVRQAGYSVWVHPQARAIHIRGASQADTALKTRIYDMSADRYYKKHYSTSIWLLQRILRKIYRIARPEAR
ncbi:MAG: hypothetical protein A2805_03890 [Candidatus Andersenbacteria bacterium RIFCSPHIGHO2_01_FULL_46_36]|uniref:Glycosyltransferase 2-like domain-containing protein n=1 Tax=Candidatus Andersenbacteria bacterium RIFCSPHIGHO2_12_FULL_45_11 TaxID=1797281 RepID=A0A1G1X5K2_9BACT|nr:MAG: hypothetical protein A2805_03890 [Candidatus Andersenbacteria bacterium RIFCSPHIGHO2_01_FULL_46_36]OGY34840.1 MAG: hypothetical protein A3D99_02955 [Candidatus Andersenbacteria bacterium RIFCSPHIGHO2_12_FULL_45_11]